MDKQSDINSGSTFTITKCQKSNIEADIFQSYFSLPTTNILNDKEILLISCYDTYIDVWCTELYFIITELYLKDAWRLIGRGFSPLLFQISFFIFCCINPEGLKQQRFSIFCCINMSKNSNVINISISYIINIETSSKNSIFSKIFSKLILLGVQDSNLRWDYFPISESKSDVLNHSTNAQYVGPTGLEPITEGPKSSVLPLHQGPI